MPARTRKKTGVPPLSDLLRTGEAVDHSRKSRRTLYRYADLGLVHRYYVGSSVYWSRSELDALVSAEQPQHLLDNGRRAAAARQAGDAA